MTSAALALLLVCGYTLTVLIEIPILIAGFGRRYQPSDTIVNGLLLTAATYPIVNLVLPAIFQMAGLNSRSLLLAVSETFAPFAEVLFFRYLMSRPLLGRIDRDAFAIVAANIVSFLLGEAGLSHWLIAMVKRIA